MVWVLPPIWSAAFPRNTRCLRDGRQCGTHCLGAPSCHRRVFTDPCLGQRSQSLVGPGSQRGNRCLQPAVTRLNLRFVEIAKLQRLCQCKDMVLSVVPDQRRLDRICRKQWLKELYSVMRGVGNDFRLRGRINSMASQVYVALCQSP